MGKSSGKSATQNNLKGERRKNKDGEDLAPRSLRKKTRLLKNCSVEQLEKLGLN